MSSTQSTWRARIRTARRCALAPELSPADGAGSASPLLARSSCAGAQSSAAGQMCDTAAVLARTTSERLLHAGASRLLRTLRQPAAGGAAGGALVAVPAARAERVATR